MKLGKEKKKKYRSSADYHRTFINQFVSLVSFFFCECNPGLNIVRANSFVLYFQILKDTVYNATRLINEIIFGLLMLCFFCYLIIFG